MGRTKRLAIVLGAIPSLAMALFVVSVNDVPATAVTTRGVLVARPAEVDFHTKRVGTENYKRTKITNSGTAAVLLVVTAGLPDDFGYGLLPGQTCPVFSPGEVIAAGDSCYAVVRFSPTEGFAGWQAVGSLTATATDPITSAAVDELSIPVVGEAVL